MSGINYFTFDGLEEAQQHAEMLNDRVSGEKQAETKRLENGILTMIFNELKEGNEFVQELQWIGRGLERTLAQNGVNRVYAQMPFHGKFSRYPAISAVIFFSRHGTCTVCPYNQKTME